MRYLVLEPRSKKVGEERGFQRASIKRDPAITPDTFSIFIFKAKCNLEEETGAFSMHGWRNKRKGHRTVPLHTQGSGAHRRPSEAAASSSGS